jgi:hypothetical protein
MTLSNLFGESRGVLVLACAGVMVALLAASSFQTRVDSHP